MEETSRRWPDPDEGPYQLTLRWSRRDGRPHVAGVHLDPLDDKSPPVTTTVMRDLKLAGIMLEDRESLDRIPQAKAAPEEIVAGMRPATVKRLRRAAAIYQEAWRAGRPPTKEVGEKMNASPAAAANLVRRARAAGMLPRTDSGVSQG
ncbi:hypothetical protein [Actinoplanes sp. NPDC051494]|uniref:hypothetical protein n=1 Tax=Actinoplanes sp. NPDC051494 TaxID=3363907 RepID=UPI0037BD1E74